MAGRVPRAALSGLAAALLVVAAASAGEERTFSTLADYQFDGAATATGPDTFTVFEKAWDGDRAAATGALGAAEDAYRSALARGGEPRRLLLKLADVRFLAGDLDGERELRERIFGSL